jgi:hypothetical protein
MELFLYGEDALAHTALTARLPELLTGLDETTLPRDCVAFFRPSFGRRGGSPTRRSAAFGEFDALLGAASAVYLIEAKWSRSLETWGKESLFLRPEQIRRHDIFRWYLTHWRDRSPSNWGSFRQQYLAAFEAEFATHTIPPEGSLLAQNLGFVLERLAPRAQRITDVILFCDIDGFTCPPSGMEKTFQTVSICFQGAAPGGFIPFERASSRSPAAV